MNDHEYSFNFIRGCLADCVARVNGHESCESHSQSPLPRRLLYFGSSNFKLIETQGELGSYVALSYCWGGESENNLRTLSCNLEQMKTGISWEDLPPVFKNAVTVSQNLGIEMVWIDALCIVQDDVRGKGLT